MHRQAQLIACSGHRVLPLVTRVSIALVIPLSISPLNAQGQGRTRGPQPGGRTPTISSRFPVVASFDKNGNGRLETDERNEARAAIRRGRRDDRRRGPRLFGGRDRDREETPRASATPREKISPENVEHYPEHALYDESILRTFFLDFENEDWEQELEDFIRTDVDVPARMTVDGKVYPDVGVRFRGSSSLYGVRSGKKRSLNLTMDWADPKQDLYGYETLDLLNSFGDPTLLRVYLFNRIARDYLPAARVNFVRLVINGESWGIYVSQQQFDKKFIKQWFDTKKGVRWEVVGDQRRRSFSYLGDRIEPYQSQFEVKSNKAENPWEPLLELCEALNETPPDCLEEALRDRLDIDRALWFLALDNVLLNADGYYFSRTSDFNLYHDVGGRFHLYPRDGNETFQERRNDWGFRVARSSSPVEHPPLAGADDRSMPLFHRLLAPETLRMRYLAHVRTITEEWLDWDRIEPIVDSAEKLISADVEKNPHKLQSFAAFQAGLRGGYQEGPREGRQREGGGRRRLGLREFVQTRRQYLLSHEDLAKPVPRFTEISLHSRRDGALVPGDPRVGESVVVSARLAPEPFPDEVRLWWTTDKHGPWDSLEMIESADGRLVAGFDPLPKGTVIRYYVEARSREHGTCSFLPRRGEAAPLRCEFKKR